VIWCKKEYLSTPEIAPGGKWCNNGAFPAPEVVVQGVWCKKECLSAPEIAPGGKWCNNEAFPAPELMGCKGFWELKAK